MGGRTARFWGRAVGDENRIIYRRGKRSYPRPHPYNRQDCVNNSLGPVNLDVMAAVDELEAAFEG